MKIDKEIIIKHRFWILLVVTMPLTLGAMFLLSTSVSGEIARQRKVIEDAEKSLKQKPPDLRKPEEIFKEKREANTEESKKDLIHKRAFEEQQNLFTWPEEVEKEFNFKSGLFAQRIKLRKGDGTAPKNQDRHIYGTIRDRVPTYFEVDSNKQVYKFFRSKTADRVIRDGEDPVPYESLNKGDKVSVEFNRGKYFAEPLMPLEAATYTKLNVYLSQIDPIMAQVDPMNDKGEGVVQLKDWFYDPKWIENNNGPKKAEGHRFISFVEGGWTDLKGDISDEAWLAQEDLWIQKEIYRLVRLANDYVGKFQGKGGKGLNQVFTFTNPFLELDVKLAPDKDTLHVTMKNLQKRQQRLNLKFRMKLGDGLPAEPVHLEGDALMPAGSTGSSRPVSIKLTPNSARDGVYEIEQILTWETAAVKRIDQISIGSLSSDEYSHSHRTFPEGMKFLRPEDAEKYKTDSTTLRPPPRYGAVIPGRGKKLAPGGKAAAAAKNDSSMTERGLIRNRYFEVLPQISRRLPVAVALIVDQDHIDRVLTAFDNSQLRFLLTQWMLNHYALSVRPQLPAPDAGVPGRRPVAPPPPHHSRRPRNQHGTGDLRHRHLVRTLSRAAGYQMSLN